MTSARLELFGGFRLTDTDGTVIDVPARKNRALLGFLAVSRKLEATRDRLSGLLWAERGEEQARSSLRQALASLRKDIAQAGADVLLLSGERVALNPRAVTVDVSQFLDEAGSTDFESLRRAAALYTGAFLDGLAVADGSLEDWLRETREHLAGHARAVLETLTRGLSGADRISFGQNSWRSTLCMRHRIGLLSRPSLPKGKRDWREGNSSPANSY